jgi:hypothetical protein
MMQIYFHSVHNLTEARFAASTYPSYIGFNFSVHQDNYLSPVDASKIIPWLSGVIMVGQFAYEPFRVIRSTMQTLGLQTVEVPLDHPELGLLLNEYDVIIINGFHPNAKASRFEKFTSEISEQPVFLEIKTTKAYIAAKKEGQILNAIAIKGNKEKEAGMADMGDWADLMEILEVF